jgi:hypothetical protein
MWGVGYVLDAFSFIRTNEETEQKTLFLLHIKALGTLHPLMLDKLRACLARGLITPGLRAMAYFANALVRP